MKKLIVYHGDSPVQVEGFPKGCARSCEGALHILPGRHKTVTDGEYQHMLLKYGWLKPKLRVVANLKDEPETKPEAKGAEGKQEKPAPSAPASADVMAKDASDSNGGKKKKQKH